MWNKRHGKIATNLQQEKRVSNWCYRKANTELIFSYCKPEVKQYIMPLKKGGVDLDLQSFSFEFGDFSFAFLDCPALPPAPHFWHCVHNPGWRSLSQPLHWGMETEHIVQVPWLTIHSDNNHSNNKKLDLFLLLGSGTALGRKRFWNYIFIKIWENILGETQGGIFNGTLKNLFSVKQRHAWE